MNAVRCAQHRRPHGQPRLGLETQPGRRNPGYLRDGELTMASLTYAAAVKKLTAEQEKLSALRDRLRDLVDDIGGQLEDVDEAVDSVTYAIDALSRHV
jgi:hypothetical protein